MFSMCIRCAQIRILDYTLSIASSLIYSAMSEKKQQQ